MFTVEFTDAHKNQKILYLEGEASLLSELEKENIVINHSCRQGNCGHCILKLTHGEVRHNESLVPLGQNEILACQSVAVSDISVHIIT